MKNQSLSPIDGGYFIIARKLWNSHISLMPPAYRETWIWLLSRANHKGVVYKGEKIERGQCLTTYKEIIDGLSWKVGYRKEHYNENHMKKVMKYLRSAGMIVTRKTTRGLFVTINNYDLYQNPKNYERTNEETIEKTNDEPMKYQCDPTINKNDKNENRKNTSVTKDINNKKKTLYKPSKEDIEFNKEVYGEDHFVSQGYSEEE
jgi:hypothetical protein